MTCTNLETDAPFDALALIHEGHRAAVQAHPEWPAVAAECDPAFQLAWMVRQGLLTYDELYDLLSFDEQASESDRFVEEAFADLGREYASPNYTLLDQLRCDELIAPAQRAAVLQPKK